MIINAMTFNIRCDTSVDGINCFDGRKALIKEMLEREKPDVIGFQEVVPTQRSWLCENLCDYAVIGAGRNADYSGESVSIAYRKDRYDLISLRQFWLSDTPDIPGSRYEIDQSVCPRICVIATLVSRENGECFVFANTHLDHVGEMAKKDGASLVIKELKKEPFPFILTGDFNARPKDPAIEAIMRVEGMKDLTESLGNDFATFHNYGKISKDYKIDYIFSNRPLCFPGLKVHTDNRNGIFLSDHYPISAYVRL